MLKKKRHKWIKFHHLKFLEVIDVYFVFDKYTSIKSIHQYNYKHLMKIIQKKKNNIICQLPS